MNATTTQPTKTATVVFTVPLSPPSVNHYKLPNRQGGWRLSREAQAFKDAVCVLGRQFQAPPAPYFVTLIYGFGPKAQIDVDNAAKLVLDGLEAAGLVSNDSQVVDLMQSKRRVAQEREAYTIISVATAIIPAQESEARAG
jgi:hypothetical protein